MTWLPHVAIHFEIRKVIGQRMEHGVTDELDRQLGALIEKLQPRWTPQNRPYVDGAKPANGASAQAGEL